ncbi:hypothetical protein EPUS_01305 [Endocarpon pusillum Z07020]|uniref:Protein kinase domain-containing protein n=1 Tax=Endocarpon pusillum (strain Z07020 / HMAS-L-300199) TaxID=1263415 RepID=U1I1X0_ENDPU|nr:uncharacterized protein EPUS_01305 [Endocarpon pusillum Z07020]ERF75939.1 hypothetical protein EPUS_01305 [Endocarpon pusillum Z07020]
MIFHTERNQSDSEIEGKKPVKEKAHGKSAQRELSVPLIEDSNQNSFEVPSKNGDSDAKLIYSVSNAHVNSRGVSGSLYKINISRGMTCNVYEVDARWAWVSTEAVRAEGSHGVKLAVKRLSRKITPKQFLQEYDTLRAVTEARHRNIVEFLNAFRYADRKNTVYYNFSFPLAAGNLKQLFRSTSAHMIQGTDHFETEPVLHRFPEGFYSTALKSFWSEFEGLASALAYLHDPSNILLYEGSGVPPIIVKLTDFGLAVALQTKLSWRLGTQEAQSAWQYDAPEIREDQSSFWKTYASRKTLQPTSEELKSGDVWKLGSVFIELLSFLVKGDTGVLQFRKFITTTHNELTSDDISDTRFDDGKKAKDEVLEWLSYLATIDVRVQEMEASLRSMVDIAFASILMARGIFESHHLDSFVLQALLTSARRWSRNGSATVWNGGHSKMGTGRVLKAIQEISWEWSSESLYIDVPDPVAQAYKETSQPISHIRQPVSCPPAPSYPPPTHNSKQIADSQFGMILRPLRNNQTLHQLRSSSPNRGRLGNISAGSSASTGALQSQNISREIYWCVDKAWSEPRITKLCSVQELHQILDDKSLCEQLMKEYNRVRTWKGRLLSWKSCLGVEFIKFSRPYPGQDDVVKIQIGLPPSDPLAYEYTLWKPEEVHMKIAATQLIASIYHPEKASGISTTLKMIPKRITAQSGSSASSEDWGMHALQRFSLWKIMTWIALLTILGLVFVVFWLVYIDKTDLQHAFMPYTFLATMVLIGLGVPQFLEVD